MSRDLLIIPAFKAAYMAAKPYAETYVDRRIAAGEVLANHRDEHIHLVRDMWACDAVRGYRSIEATAARMLPLQPDCSTERSIAA